MSEVFSLHGTLGHPLGERPATPISAETRDIFGSAYTIGDRSLLLPELPGTITETGDGIEFQLNRWARAKDRVGCEPGGCVQVRTR